MLPANQVGLNNMKANDYANVAIQLLTRIAPLRDFFLQQRNYASCRSLVVQRFGELVRKLWNPRNFKGQVSPHEFMQAVMAASKKRFIIDSQSDPVDFLTWLVNELHLQLTNGKRKARSIITECLQGELLVVTEAGTGKAADVRALNYYYCGVHPCTHGVCIACMRLSGLITPTMLLLQSPCVR